MICDGKARRRGLRSSRGSVFQAVAFVMVFFISTLADADFPDSYFNKSAHIIETIDTFALNSEWPKSWPRPNATIYPPYPDVWEREIPAPQKGYFTTAIYDVGLDDRLIMGRWGETAIANERTWHFQEFFSGTTWRAVEEDAVHTVTDKDVMALSPVHVPRNLYYIPLSDGTIIDFGRSLDIREYPRIRKFVNFEFFGHKNIDKRLTPWKEETFSRRTIIRLREAPITISISRFGKAPLIYQSRIDPWGLSVKMHHILLDGTFLAIINDTSGDESERHIVRFDAGLHSPYLQSRSDLYVLDYAELEPILKAADARYADDTPELHEFIDQRITDYLLRRKTTYP